MTEPMAHWRKDHASAVTPKMSAGKDVPRKHGGAQPVTRSPSRNWSARQSGWLACNVTDLFVLVSASVGSKMANVTVNGRGRTNREKTDKGGWWNAGMLWSVASQSLNLSKSSYLRGLRLRFDSATDKSCEIKWKGGSVGKSSSGSYWGFLSCSYTIHRLKATFLGCMSRERTLFDIVGSF